MHALGDDWPYRLIRRLGQGPGWPMYVGEHSILGRQAAIRALPLELSQKRDVVGQFFDEAQASLRGSIRHRSQDHAAITHDWRRGANVAIGPRGEERSPGLVMRAPGPET